MIDETSPAATVANQEKTINAEGNNEQWRRHLEKAHFERQREAMQNKPRDARVRAPAAPDDPASRAHTATALPTPADTRAESVERDINRLDSQGKMLVNVGAAGTARAPGQGQSSLSTAARGHATASNVSSVEKQAASAPRTLPRWREALPGSSSASVLQSEHGAHLVVRDASLAARTVLLLLPRLRTLFAAEGEFLRALTLNGDQLWQAPDRSGSNIESDHNISRKY